MAKSEIDSDIRALPVGGGIPEQLSDILKHLASKQRPQDVAVSLRAKEAINPLF
jgi:hypothetical protein